MDAKQEAWGCWGHRFFARGEAIPLQDNFKGKIELLRGKVVATISSCPPLASLGAARPDVTFSWEIEDREEQENPEWVAVDRVAGCPLRNVDVKGREGGGRMF